MATRRPLAFLSDNTVSELPDADQIPVANVPGGVTGKAFLALASPGAIRFARINADGSVDVLSAADFRSAIGTAIGTNVQAWSANLDEYSAVNPTTFGLSLLDDADAAAGRTTLGLGTMATQNANAVAITGGTINGTTIGATTPSTGAFTALSTTGLATFSIASGNQALQIHPAATGRPTHGGAIVLTQYSTTSAATQGIEFHARGDLNGFGNRFYSLANNCDLVFEDRSASASWSERFRLINGTGAAITGTLSCTGNATLGDATSDAHTINGSLTGSLGASNWTLNGTGTNLFTVQATTQPVIRVSQNSGAVIGDFLATSTGVTLRSTSAHNLVVGRSGGAFATFDTTTCAITGALSVSGTSALQAVTATTGVFTPSVRVDASAANNGEFRLRGRNTASEYVALTHDENGTLRAALRFTLNGGDGGGDLSYLRGVGLGSTIFTANASGLSITGTLSTTGNVTTGSEILVQNTATAGTGQRNALRFYSLDSAANLDQMALIDVNVTDTTSGSEDATLRLWNIVNGTLSVGAQLTASGLTVTNAVTVSGNLISFGSGSTLAPYIQHSGATLDIKGGSTGGLRVLNNAGTVANAVFADAGGLLLTGFLDTRPAGNSIMFRVLETTSGSSRRIQFENAGTVNRIESTTGSGSTSLALAVDTVDRLVLSSSGGAFTGAVSASEYVSAAKYNQVTTVHTVDSNTGTENVSINWSNGSVQKYQRSGSHTITSITGPSEFVPDCSLYVYKSSGSGTITFPSNVIFLGQPSMLGGGSATTYIAHGFWDGSKYYVVMYNENLGDLRPS